MNYRFQKEVNNPKFQDQISNEMRDIQISEEMSRDNLFRKYRNNNVVDNVAMRSQQELSSMHNAGRAFMNKEKDPISSKIIADAKERTKLLKKYHSNSIQEDTLDRARERDAINGVISGKRAIEEAKNLGRRSIPEITDYIGEKINPVDWITTKMRGIGRGINLKKKGGGNRFGDEINRLATGALISEAKNEVYNYTD